MPASTSVTTPTDQITRRRDLRRARYAAQRVVWAETQLASGKVYTDRRGVVRQSSRLRACGRHLLDNAGGVQLRASADGTRAGFGGLQTCGSVWSCPVCSEKINAGRQRELEGSIALWQAQGGAVVFGTLTMRHNKGHSLRELWDALSPAWAAITSKSTAWRGGRRQVGDVQRFGIAHWVRLVEVKHGEHGWHPHIHFLLFLTTELQPAELLDLESRMFARWEAALANRGHSVLREHGIDLRPVLSGERLADYFTKNTYGTSASAAAYEVTGSQSKKLGKGGLTPFQLLERLVNDGDEADLRRWHEWETASQGRRQLTWSKGAKAALLVEDVTDEELAEDDAGDDTILTIQADSWTDARCAYRRVELLEAVEAGTALQLVRSWGLTYWAGAHPPVPRE